MSPRSRDSALLDLWVDAWSEGDPPLEWLVRYAQDPGAVPAEQRSAIERRMAESPVYAEELRTLQRLTAMTSPARAKLEPAKPSPLARLRAALAPLFEGPAAGWGLAAAAAAVLFAVIYGGVWRPTDRPGEAGPAVAQGPAVPEPPLEVPRSPEPSPATGPSPDAVAAEAPGTGVPAVPEPPAPARRPPAPQPAPKPQPVLLAMALPEYRPPAGAVELGASGGIIRGSGHAIELRALAPAHAGLCATPAPVLLWDLSGTPPTGAGTFELVVQDPSSPDPLLEVALEVERAGIQRVDLAEYGAALSPGIDYAWSIAFRADPEHRSRDPFARGWIRHEPAPVALTAASAAEAPRALAAQGYWYDALARVRDALGAQPDDPSARAAWDALLASADIALD